MVSGGRYANSTTPQRSDPFTSSPLYWAHTCGSMRVSLFVTSKNGNEKDTASVFMSISTLMRVSNLTVLYSTMMSSFIFSHLSLRGIYSSMNSMTSVTSNSPSLSSNLRNTQSRRKDGNFIVLKKLFFFKSLKTTLLSKHSISCSDICITHSSSLSPPLSFSILMLKLSAILLPEE